MTDVTVSEQYLQYLEALVPAAEEIKHLLKTSGEEEHIGMYPVSLGRFDGTYRGVSNSLREEANRIDQTDLKVKDFRGALRIAWNAREQRRHELQKEKQ